MPNMNHSIDLVAEQLEKPEGGARFTSFDLKYAFGQNSLDTQAAEQCNFQFIGGETTGTCRFSTGFYGLTTMPTQF